MIAKLQMTFQKYRLTVVRMFITFSILAAVFPLRAVADEEELVKAIKERRVEEAIRLIPSCDDPNSVDEDSHSLLWLAIHNNLPAVAASLLIAGADVNKTSQAVVARDVSSEYLNAKGIPVPQGKYNMKTLVDYVPLHEAAQTGAEVIQVLIDAGADVNLRNSDDVTALHRTKDLAVARLLVKNGASLNCRDRWGTTPLQSAIKASADVSDCVEIVAYFLEQGAADYEMEGENLVDYAIHHSAPSDVVDILIAYTLAPNSDDYSFSREGCGSYHVPQALECQRIALQKVTDPQSYLDAISLFTMAIGLDPELYPSYLYIGAYYASREELEKAVELLSAGVQYCPGACELYVDLAHYQKVLGDTEVAMRTLSSITSENGIGSECLAKAYYNLGNLLAEDEQLEKAIGSYSKAIKADAYHLKARRNLIITLQRLGKADEAIAQASALVELDRRSEEGEWAAQFLDQVQ